MRFFNILCMLVLFQFCSHIDTNTIHYVDKNASGSDDGTSWTNAWESLSDIEWNQIQPGDVLYISGGTDSTVYNERLFVQASGTAANHIQIRNSYETNHTGRVILYGDMINDGIIFDNGAGPGEEYVIIKGLELHQWRRGIYLRYAPNVITIDSCIIMNYHGSGIDVIANDFAGGADSLTFQNIVVMSPIDVPYQTDAFYLKYCSNVILRDSYLHIRNRSDVNSHSDVIQTNPVRGFKVYNNVMICDSNSYGIVYIAGAASTDNDSVIIYNNYMYGGGIWRNGAEPWVVGLNPESKSYFEGDPAPHFIAHNTIVVQGPWYAGCNNIIVQFEGTNAATTPPLNGFDYDALSYLWLETFRNTSVAHIDSVKNNLMWTEWSTGHFRGGPFEGIKYYSWAEWVAAGGTGVNGDPLFVTTIGTLPSDEQGDYNGELQAGSPAINQGLDIQAIIEKMGLPWEDINGNPRDSTPDIGAYEYVP